MTAREWLYERLTGGAPVPADEATTGLDAYRAEVLAKAVGRLRAVPLECTALTGPVWYGQGWKDCIDALVDIVDYQQPDDEAYPGELGRLRALVVGLRVAALRREDLPEVRRRLAAHALYETEARKTSGQQDATPFFQPGHVYALADDWQFRCDTVSTDPNTGERAAIGWLRVRSSPWTTYAYTASEWDGDWADVTGEVAE
ncbi:hypothetical protein ABZX85_23095 [Streptomyces sp. NPDC004539]|uniref:hypothetical protein n=1 Tax=Streptomyces sp. NPDC004539 TaxID=3154280 RepID=UPI0033AF7436